MGSHRCALPVEQRLELARLALGRSVVALNERIVEEVSEKPAGCALVGVKDTSSIPEAYIDRLRRSPQFAVLTVDRMADMGRSVDTDLVNPLTYRPMTGSTSGGAVNVLKGITDVALGTDGGGSVLAPALATGLFSFMGKGAGLVAGAGRSTDGMPFSTGVGFIARSFDLAVRAAEVAGDIDLGSDGPFDCGAAVGPGCGDGVRVIVPADGCMPLPGGGDGGERARRYLEAVGVPAERVAPYAFVDPYDRAATVADLQRLYADDPEAVIASFEGPIDVLSADETIPRAIGGRAAEVVAQVRSKGLVKAVNIAGGSAVTLPVPELACGLVLTCAPGLAAARRLVRLAARVERCLELPELLCRYYLDRAKPYEPLRPF